MRYFLLLFVIVSRLPIKASKRFTSFKIILLQFVFSFAGLSLDQSLSMSSLGPQSPLEMKPDPNVLSQFSPQGPNSPGSYSLSHANLLSPSPGGGQKGAGSPYPPNHPLSNSKHLCSICGDRASGKHYGVYR